MRALLLSIALLMLALPTAAHARPKKAKVTKKARPVNKAKIAKKKDPRKIRIYEFTITARPQVPVIISIPVKARRYTRPDLQLRRQAYRSYR